MLTCASQRSTKTWRLWFIRHSRQLHQHAVNDLEPRRTINTLSHGSSKLNICFSATPTQPQITQERSDFEHKDAFAPRNSSFSIRKSCKVGEVALEISTAARKGSDQSPVLSPQFKSLDCAFLHGPRGNKWHRGKLWRGSGTLACRGAESSCFPATQQLITPALAPDGAAWRRPAVLLRAARVWDVNN